MQQKEPVPFIRCSECKLPLRYLNTQPTVVLYGCTNGHIRRVARPDGKKVSIQWNSQPPNNAA